MVSLLLTPNDIRCPRCGTCGINGCVLIFVDLHSTEPVARDPRMISYCTSMFCLIVGGTAANINGAPQFPAGSSTPVTSASQKGRCACAINFTFPWFTVNREFKVIFCVYLVSNSTQINLGLWPWLMRDNLEQIAFIFTLKNGHCTFLKTWFWINAQAYLVSLKSFFNISSLLSFPKYIIFSSYNLYQ